MSIISEMLKHNISFHFKYGCWTRRKKKHPKDTLYPFFFYPIFDKDLDLMSQTLLNTDNEFLVFPPTYL